LIFLILIEATLMNTLFKEAAGPVWTKDLGPVGVECLEPTGGWTVRSPVFTT
jgi:hypothetical protein